MKNSKYEKFKIACRAFFPNCKFSDLDERDITPFMSEVEYAPKKHAWACMYVCKPGDKPGKPIKLDKPFYQFEYEIDERSYATRQAHFYTTDLDEFTQGIKKVIKEYGNGMAYTKEDLEYEDLKWQERLEEQEREEFENYLRLKAKYEGKGED